ncbi:response regulator transcription factor [Hoyosella altamirensis]|uniref:DNA-binding NarL/FixJ family response regulator n=1 Tax=Hoyosella altamirensis TaxID=616997 RepID=A0A839RIJ0_9ACTN|nr:response regulator transcription factor [Hoyosella altamirensis]MBB3036004.1 DNA-binding NarL/FixJ family response regulator [Hoyosella altamirensis]
MIRVLLVDDQELVRTGLRALLERDGDIEVVGEASNGRSGVSAAGVHRPDVVLMDLRMPVLDGVSATREVTANPALSSCRVVALTTFDDEELILDVIRAGASGFLLKDISPEELRAGVRTVAGGNALLSPAVTATVLRQLARSTARSPSSDTLKHLTGRETEVLAAVGRGLNNEEIGAALFISPATARTYVSRLLSKLGARDRAQLVVIAFESGLYN